MKKLLALLGTVGLTATAGMTVVACGNTSKDEVEKPTTNQGEDFSQTSHIMNIGSVLQTRKNMWFNLKQFRDFNQGTLDQETTSELIWTGMLDARHGVNEKGTSDALNEFKEKNIASRLHLIGETENIISLEKIKSQLTEAVKNITYSIENEQESEAIINLRYAIGHFNVEKNKENTDILSLFNDVMESAKEYNNLETTTNKLKTKYAFELGENSKKLSVKVDNNMFVYFTTDNSKIEQCGIVASQGSFVKLAVILTF